MRSAISSSDGQRFPAKGSLRQARSSLFWLWKGSDVLFPLQQFIQGNW